MARFTKRSALVVFAVSMLLATLTTTIHPTQVQGVSLPDLTIANICRLNDGAPDPNHPGDSRFVTQAWIRVTIANIGDGPALGPFNVGIFSKGSALRQKSIQSLAAGAEQDVVFHKLTIGLTGGVPAWSVQVDRASFANGAFFFPNAVVESEEDANNMIRFHLFRDLPLCDA